MKKWIAMVLVICMAFMGMLPALAETTALTGNAQLIYDEIRWNVDLPKQAMVVHAEEYLFKLTKEITLHTLMAEVTVNEELEMMYGTGAKVIIIDLDTGDVIDYKNFDGNVTWPEGDITSRSDALHLLFNSYCSCIDGYNDMLMSEFEIIMPLADEEVAAINAALAEVFIRSEN